MTDPAPSRERPLEDVLSRAPWWALPAALGVGVMSAAQSRINAELARQLQDPFAAALISFGTGLLIVFAVLGVTPRVRRLVRRFAHDLRSGAFSWVLAIGGLGGAFFVLTQGLSVPFTGVALFVLAVVTGQTATGLVVDRWGLGPGGPRRLTVPRMAGAALMVLAVGIAMSGAVRIDASWVLLVLPLIAGCGMALQQAVNGRVSQHGGHVMVATFGNFVVGTGALLLIALVHMAVAGPPRALPTNPVLYLGGAIGVVFIALAAHLAKPLGILTLAMGTIAGQVLGSLVLDVIDGQLRGMTVVGAVLTLVAVAITAGVRPHQAPSRAT
ncbi:MAG: DMT family transporter [Brachybacterium sp.]|nr:DMT family transporter [Brachybacterium sp.]